MIKIKGIIGEEYTYSTFVAALSKEHENVIEVEIDSIGGYVEAGFAIYEHLMELKGQGKRIVTRAVNECMSIASIIFMAGDVRLIGCQLMIHNPWGTATGNADELKTYVKEVEAIERQLEQIYAERASVDKAVVSRLMDFETYLEPEDAVDLGFATSILTATKAQRRGSTPKAIINKNVKLKFSKMAEKKSARERVKEWKKALLALAGNVKNVQYPTTDGGMLELEKEDGAPEIGDVSISEDGTYNLDNGLTVVVEGGLVTAVDAGNELTIEELTNLLDEAEEVIDALEEELQASGVSEEDEKILKAVKAAGGLEKLLAGKTKSNFRPRSKENKADGNLGGVVNKEELKAQLAARRKGGQFGFGKK